MSERTDGHTPPAEADGPTQSLESLTEDVLPALIARLRLSRLGELEVRTDGWRVRLRRDPSAGPLAGTTSSAGVTEAPDEHRGSVARSSAVGYFTPAADLVVGRSVQAGDVIGTIDVLGIAQEVTAPEAGTVAAVLAEDGQAVEFGQALAEIDPQEVEPTATSAEGVA